MAAVAVVLASPPPMAGLVSVGWGSGACNLELSSSILGGLPPQAAARRGSHRRPSLCLHRELHVHRYLPDGRPWTYEFVDLPDRVCVAGRLCSPPRNARAVFADMVQAMAYTGGAHLPSLLQMVPPVRMTEETQRDMVDGQLVGAGRATGTERQQEEEEGTCVISRCGIVEA